MNPVSRLPVRPRIDVPNGKVNTAQTEASIFRRLLSTLRVTSEPQKFKLIKNRVALATATARGDDGITGSTSVSTLHPLIQSSAKRSSVHQKTLALYVCCIATCSW